MLYSLKTILTFGRSVYSLSLSLSFLPLLLQYVFMGLPSELQSVYQHFVPLKLELCLSTSVL